MPLSFRLTAVDAAIFPVERRYFSHFSGWVPLTPLFFQLNVANAAISRLISVNAVIYLVKRR